ncbi:integrase arm-type DNA-binding domain-containing protein [Mesorhizobium sp. VNQ89]|uniref:tyrosine-type recombinase/integrase n=1 Tax=Mesorhizobium quangtriensis TaxID=3157709 RepID=UPI0032B73547
MARTLHKMSDASVKAEKQPGRHSDGGGLYLNVGPTGKKSWLFMWVPKGGKRREMGLGAYPTVKLAGARAKAAECRVAIEDGRDPIAEKAKQAEPTFGECVDLFISSIKSEWRNEKHQAQWKMTLSDAYCASLRPKLVSAISTEDVLSVLKPVWLGKNETASRLRGRIERVLEFAKVKGWRSGENPAAWRGNLRNLLPKRQKLQRGHQPAMRYQDVPKFVERLRASEALAARALEFVVLTVGRSGEVLGATWSEIDFDEKLWNVPKERMKAGLAHTVPLSTPAMKMLNTLHEHRTSEFVFPRTEDKPLSDMAMLMLLRRMKLKDITVHGFRSSFRDWCGDATTFPREVAEAALAHKVGDETERAYRRSDALEKRRKLMQAWADYVGSVKAGNVTQFRKKTANPQG